MNRKFPQTFGRYVLTRLLGEGGMAEVYEASVPVAEGLNKWIVIKKIRKEFADQPEFMRMFVDEAKIALSLNHANLIQVFDFGDVRGNFYLAMELIEGIDLMELFQAMQLNSQPMHEGLIAFVGQQVSAGLAYAHNKVDEFGNPLGIVHRDISPHNIMVDFAGNVKVLDFGVARVRGATNADESDRDHSQAATLKGKIAYMSPEQIAGRPVDQRSDIYAIGVVLYELCSRQLVFRDKNKNRVFERVKNEPLTPLRHRSTHVSPELAKIVDRALARNPDDRYPTSRALQADLARHLHQMSELIDSDALSQFVSDYRPKKRAPRPLAGSDQIATRGVENDGLSLLTAGPRQRSQRVILLQAAFEPRTTLPGEESPDVTPFLDVVQDIAFKRDAYIHHIDRRGALLAFGTVITSGDDSDRALRVGLALREAISEAAPGVGLGVVLMESTVIVTRDEHSREHIELPTSLAENLEHVCVQALDDRIMVSSPMVERLGKMWHFGDPRLPVSDDSVSASILLNYGLDQLTPLLGPLSESERHVRHAPGRRVVLYGRELELKTLRDTFSDAIRKQESRNVMVVGDPGLGRRAVVERFISSLPRGACAIFRGAGQWAQRNTPFRVYINLIRRFLSLSPESGKEDIKARLTAHRIKEPDELAEALASILGLDGGNEHEIDPHGRRDQLHRLVRRLITSVAHRSPVLIVIENLPFVDQQSLDILTDAASGRHPQPVLTIVTSRPGPRVESLRNSTNMSTITLRELDEHARRQLIVRRFQDQKSANRLADAILVKAGGNPLFIEEILASLLHRRDIVWDPQGRYLSIQNPNASIVIPPTIEDALQSRLDALPRSTREVLRLSGVLGRHVRLSELSKILERDVDRDVDTLLAHNLLERDPAPAPDGGTMLRFPTVSLHEVCKSSPSAEQRQALHSRAAQIKLGRGDYAEGRDDGAVAEHLVAAGDPTAAITPALRAADNALDVAGNVEAYHYYTLALKAMGDEHPERFEALLAREPILRSWGRRRAQGVDIRAMLSVAEATNDPTKEAQAAIRLLRFYIECGRAHRAESLSPRLEKLVASIPTPTRFAAVIGELKSEMAYGRGDHEQAEELARVALTSWQEADNSASQQVRLLLCIGRVELATNRFEKGHQTLTSAVSIAQEQHQRRLEAEGLNLLGEVARHLTRYQEAVNCFRRAIAIDRDLGDRVHTGVKLANLGITYTSIGVYQWAERYLRKALELHEALENPQLLNEVMIHLGEVAAELNDTDVATGLLNDAIDFAVEREDARLRLRAEISLAAILIRKRTESDIQRANELIDNAIDEARSSNYPTQLCRGLHLLATIFDKSDNLTAAVELEREAVALVRDGAAPVDGVLSIHNLGVLLRKLDRKEEASAYLREAAAMLASRLSDIQDPDLRRSYEEQPRVQWILEDGRGAGYDFEL